MNLRIKVPVPRGWRIWRRNVPVMGTRFRNAAAIRFAYGKDYNIRLVREPDNVHDEHAIQVIGLRRLFLFIRVSEHIGYVPAEIALEIARMKGLGTITAHVVSVSVEGWRPRTVHIEFSILKKIA